MATRSIQACAVERERVGKKRKGVVLYVDGGRVLSQCDANEGPLKMLFVSLCVAELFALWFVIMSIILFM